MKPPVYLETTIPSYLVARPSRDIIVASRQEFTRQWWEAHRDGYDVYISEVVIAEASLGDPETAAKRLGLVGGLPRLAITPEVDDLAVELMKFVGLPENTEADVYHLAVAVLHEMDYLVTWNCGHLANARLRHRLEGWSLRKGRSIPTVCTPEELIEEEGVSL